MILGFMQKMPDGTPTNFENKILTGEKIHSIRPGERWRAGMPIQMAHGVRTKYYRQFNAGVPHLQTCVSVQDIFMTYERWGALEITIDADNYLVPSVIQALIKNDGITREQFIKWFFPKDVYSFRGQLIHWTNYRY